MAKQSLASQAGAIAAPQLELPAVFTAPQEKIAPRDFSPYITFAHPKRTDEWKLIVASYGANVDEGDTFLIHRNVPTKLDIWKASWFCHKQYWAKTDSQGKVLRTSYKETPEIGKEHVEAVVLLYHGEGCLPCNIQLRTTKCGPASKISKALDEAATPEWAAKSAEHKETLVVAQPNLRFYGSFQILPVRTGRGTGNPYRPLSCDIKPTGPTEWRALKTFQEDSESKDLLDRAAKRFKQRIDEVEKMLGGAPAAAA